MAAYNRVEAGSATCPEDQFVPGSKTRGLITSHSFAHAYAEPPTVVWAVDGAVGGGDGEDNDFHVWVNLVTNTGFKLNCYTYNLSKLKYISVKWFAFAKA